MLATHGGVLTGRHNSQLRLALAERIPVVHYALP
jgi:hypothetical protein